MANVERRRNTGRYLAAGWLASLGASLVLAGCSFAVSNTESLLGQAGFRKVPADTPRRAQHIQTIAPHRLIRRKSGDTAYYVYADPTYCKCMYVGDEAAYARYKVMVRQQEEMAYLEEEREEEGFQGTK